MPETNNDEEIIEDVETDESETEETEETTEETEDGKSDEGKKPSQPAETEDEKEKARKGFELRQQKKTEKVEARQEIEEIKKDISATKEENTDLKFRFAHPGIKDEEFNSIKAHAKGTGKSYEDTLNDPVFKGYFKDKDTRKRLDGATAEPSSRAGSGDSAPDYSNMTSAEFQAQKNKVLQQNRS